MLLEGSSGIKRLKRVGNSKKVKLAHTISVSRNKGNGDKTRLQNISNKAIHKAGDGAHRKFFKKDKYGIAEGSGSLQRLKRKSNREYKLIAKNPKANYETSRELTRMRTNHRLLGKKTEGDSRFEKNKEKYREIGPSYKKYGEGSFSSRKHRRNFIGQPERRSLHGVGGESLRIKNLIFKSDLKKKRGLSEGSQSNKRIHRLLNRRIEGKPTRLSTLNLSVRAIHNLGDTNKRRKTPSEVNQKGLQGVKMKALRKSIGQPETRTRPDYMNDFLLKRKLREKK
jgi:hypothetical protein